MIVDAEARRSIAAEELKDAQQLERLAILLEELGEVQQIVGKIIRHGYESYNPFDESETTNRCLLEKELGHVEWIVNFMAKNNDISKAEIAKSSAQKQTTISQYLHHNKI